MAWDSTTPSNAEYIYTGDSLVPTAYDFTLVQWVKVQTVGADDSVHSIGTNSPDRNWELRLQTGANEWDLEGWDGSLPEPTLQFSDATTAAGTWKVVTTGWSANGSDADAFVSINGESSSNHTETITTFDPSPTSPEFRLGVNRYATSGRVLDGWHGAAALYDRLLTDAEISSHHISSEKGVYPWHVAESALLGVWLIDGDGTKALHNIGVDLTETTTSVTYTTSENPTYANRITRSNFVTL